MPIWPTAELLAQSQRTRSPRGHCGEQTRALGLKEVHARTFHISRSRVSAPQPSNSHSTVMTTLAFECVMQNSKQATDSQDPAATTLRLVTARHRSRSRRRDSSTGSLFGPYASPERSNAVVDAHMVTRFGSDATPEASGYQSDVSPLMRETPRTDAWAW
jgi:hypothetical protein